jgi:hypothetical protein
MLEGDETYPWEFRRDGTFEYVQVVTVEVPLPVGGSGDIKKQRSRHETLVKGLYRWVDSGSIELLEQTPSGEWTGGRCVLEIEGDRLTLLGPDGTWLRFTRSR